MRRQLFPIAGRKAEAASDRGGLTRGALAARTGCNIETIRYYEKIGLLPPPPRSAGGHRLYGRDLVKRLNFVRRSRDLGFTLDEIRELLHLVDGGTYTCGEVEQLARDHVREIRRKIADLRTLQRVLKTMAAQCSGGAVPDCPIIDALFDLDRLSPATSGLRRSRITSHQVVGGG
jgi:MerR family transcriptional regulator, mercuric resistance operon regulatory protein